MSQTIKRLIESGYVEKRYMKNDEKTARLYVIEKGKRLSSVHKAYNIADITQTTAYLIEQCNETDLEAFYRIVERYIELLKEELQPEFGAPTSDY